MLKQTNVKAAATTQKTRGNKYVESYKSNSVFTFLHEKIVLNWQLSTPVIFILSHNSALPTLQKVINCLFLVKPQILTACVTVSTVITLTSTFGFTADASLSL